MATVGYRRVSSEDQKLDRQELGPTDKVFEEKVSGKSASDRPALQAMLDYVRDGDLVVVHSIDRLARDLRDLQALVQAMNDKGVAVSFLSERLTFSANTEDPLARLQLHLIGAFAQFERSIIRKRQAEGIAKAKARGVYTGRKPTIDRDKVRSLKSQGLSTYKIASALGISRMTVHRILNG
jgi:DNA invertase Pin-like site-specific DNA recombinase